MRKVSLVQSSFDFVQKRMEPSELTYYKLNKRLLCHTGLWHYQNWRDKFVRRLVIFAILFSCAAVQVRTLMSLECTLQLIASCIPFSLLITITAIRYTDLCANDNNRRDLYENIIDDWAITRQSKELAIKDKTAEEGRVYMFYCAMFAYSCEIFLILATQTPLVLDFLFPLNETRTRSLPFPIEHFIDQNKHYYLVLLHLCLSVHTAVTIVLASDSTYVTYVQHACGMFRVAGYQMENAIWRSKWAHRVERSREVKARIVYAVKKHSNALAFTATINNKWGHSDFICLTLCALSMSTSLLFVATSVGNFRDMMTSIVLAAGQIFYILFDTYPAQKLINDSTEILYKVYNTWWYTEPPSTQKLILLIMQKAITPSVLFIGKIVPNSFESYGVILQISLSFFTTLLSLR